MPGFTIALFGEAERGAFNTIYHCTSLMQLSEFFGNPPQHSRGLYYAIQALFYHNHLLFCRVKEEGYSASEYLNGLYLLKQVHMDPKIKAIGFPGVGSAGIIDSAITFCSDLQCVLLTNEADLYDFVTDRP